MPYLQNILKESKWCNVEVGESFPSQAKNGVALRLYPPVPINTRFCKHATTLPRGGGPDGCSPILVREGMPIAYSVYHMQRREDLYGLDAGTFRPERWDGSELADIKWGYLPFNGGPRVCLGSKSHKRSGDPSRNWWWGFRGLWAHACFIRDREDRSSLSENRACSGRDMGRARGGAATSYPYPFKCRRLQSPAQLTVWRCLTACGLCHDTS